MVAHRAVCTTGPAGELPPKMFVLTVEAAKALKLTAPDLMKAAIIDEIVPEPVGGAHTDVEAAAALVDTAISSALADISALDSETRLQRRYEKFRNMGRAGIDFVEQE